MLKQIKKYLFFFFLLISSSSFATNTTDSLFLALEQTEDEIEKVNILNLIGDALVETKTDSADIFYNQALQIANQLLNKDYDEYEKHKILSYKAKVLSGLGYVYYLKYDYKKAIKLLEESIKIKDDILDIEDVKYYLNHLSLCYYQLGDYQSSIEYLYGALEKNNEINTDKDIKFEATIYYELAKNYFKLEQFEKSIEFYEKSIKIAEEIKFTEILPLVYNGIAASHLHIKNIKNAELYLLKAKKIAIANDLKNHLPETYAYIAQVKIEKNELDSALIYLNDAENLALNQNNIHDLIQIYKIYTLYQLKIKNLDEATYYAKKYLKLGLEKHDLNIITEANKLLYEIYDAKKEYIRAYEYLKNYLTYKDSLAIDEAKNIVLKQELKIQQEQKAYQDSLRFNAFRQEKENQLNIQKLNTEKVEGQKKLLYVILFILTVLVFVFIWNLKQKKKANTIISSKAKEVEEQKKLLELQNEKLKTDALLYQILKICSSDEFSIHKILQNVLQKLNDVDFIGTINKSAVLSYSKNKDLLNIETQINLTETEQQTLINIVRNKINSNDFTNDKIKEYDIDNLGNFYYIPLLKDDNLLGVTILFKQPQKKVTDFEIRFLESIRILYRDTLYRHKITDKLRLAHLENTIKKKEIQRAHQKVNIALKQQEAINKLMNKIIRNENVGEHVYKYIKDVLGEVVIKRLNITLFDFEKQKVNFYFLREDGIETVDTKPFPISHFSEETLNNLKKNKRTIIKSIIERKTKSETDLKMLRNGINAFASFPLYMDNKLLGALNISFEDNVEFTKDQEQFFAMLVEGVTIAIHQNMLFNEISSKNNELSKLHQEISSSINYAKKLQNSILPSQEYIDEVFKENFTILKQRDIVGGDFYWFSQYDGYKMAACIDCTGHSVPGAFMTMLSRVLLRKTVTVKGLRLPNKILSHMNSAVKHILKQHNYQAMQDGMDMSIAVVDEAKQLIHFSSAQRPIIIKFKGKEKLTLIRGSRFAVGGYSEIEKFFDIHTYKLDEVESFYLFSDGFTDQFGGENIKKYGSKKFLATLNLIVDLPMNQQKAFLINEFENWKGELNQIDDVSVIGIKMS
jgi:hypothetical protein